MIDNRNEEENVVEEEVASGEAEQDVRLNLDTPVENVAAETEYQYRYVCPACTNVAYYAVVVSDEHPVSVCKNCGNSLGEVDQSSFVPLTEDQKQSLKELGV